jgi:DeoR/GlpR family transcriptional regulator of sugar metabolism
VLEARTALVDRADVLVATPIDTLATRRMVERALRAGVPIISESTRYPGATTSVSINDYQAGVEMGRWVAAYADRHLNGQVMVLDVTSSLPNTDARSRGFADGLQELPAGTRRIIRVNGQNMRESAYQITADALSVYPDVNVIFGINDDSALGSLDAYRAAGLDESRLLVVSFGLEGNAAKDALEQAGPYKASVAMFPELIGKICVDTAVCAYHGCLLPERLFAPYAIITRDNLRDYYHNDETTGTWLINWQHALKLSDRSPSLALVYQCRRRPKPAHIGYLQIFSSHEWYQNMERAMQMRSRELGIQLEVVDISHDLAQETNSLKRVIGRAAAKTVNEGDTIILDAGITTTYMAAALRGKQGITVITNSLPVLAELNGEEAIGLISSGGVVRHKSQSLTGPGAEALFRDLRVDKAFIAATGINIDFGLSNTNVAEATVKQEMIKAAREVILLVDFTKIGSESLVKIAPVEAVHKIITDIGVSAHDRQSFTQRGIDVIIAED